MHASQPLRLRESQWTPPPEATDHAGGLLALDREFIAAPPVVIGPVLSAGSTVRKNQFIWPKWLRAVRCLAWGAGTYGAVEAGIAAAARYWGAGEEACNITRGIGISVAPCITLLSICQTKWRERCTFVGRDGVAEFTHAGGAVKKRILCFLDAADVQSSHVDQYLNLAYAGTAYSYVWRDANSKKLLAIEGYHHSRKGEPPAHSSYHFAVAAHRAWTHHVTTRSAAGGQSLARPAA